MMKQDKVIDESLSMSDRSFVPAQMLSQSALLKLSCKSSRQLALLSVSCLSWHDPQFLQ